MTSPMISYVTWNRMGLTVRNLSALLSGNEDFELHIIDNNSSDDSWEFIRGLKDERIKSRERFELNRGHIYATNYILSKRKKEQYFITVDNDVRIHTSDWISRFMGVFSEFPEVGLLGAVTEQYYKNYKLTHLRRERNGIYYLQICKGFVEGCCQCIRPEVFDLLGYWDEESHLGDLEICLRIQKFTPYKAGFLPAIKIDQQQKISCDECMACDLCSLDKSSKTCFTMHGEKYNSPALKRLYGDRYREYLKANISGRSKAYCASIHDKESLARGRYNAQKAQRNFMSYINLKN